MSVNQLYSISRHPEYADGHDDPLFQDAKRICAEMGQISISTIQRKFKVSFYRAASLVRAMEVDGMPVNQMTKDLARRERGQ